jgi:hypothetical protein
MTTSKPFTCNGCVDSRIERNMPAKQKVVDCWRCAIGEPIQFHVCESPRNPLLDTHVTYSNMEDPKSWGKAEPVQERDNLDIAQVSEPQKDVLIEGWEKDVDSYHCRYCPARDNDPRLDCATDMDNLIVLIKDLLEQQHKKSVQMCIETFLNVPSEEVETTFFRTDEDVIAALKKLL